MIGDDLLAEDTTDVGSSVASLRLDKTGLRLGGTANEVAEVERTFRKAYHSDDVHMPDTMIYFSTRHETASAS